MKPFISLFLFKAQIIKTSAIGALVIQFFVPFKINSLFVSSKVVFIDEGSEPASLSVKAKQPTLFPNIRSGRYSFFCSSEPKL